MRLTDIEIGEFRHCSLSIDDFVQRLIRAQSYAEGDRLALLGAIRIEASALVRMVDSITPRMVSEMEKEVQKTKQKRRKICHWRKLKGGWFIPNCTGWMGGSSRIKKKCPRCKKHVKADL